MARLNMIRCTAARSTSMLAGLLLVGAGCDLFPFPPCPAEKTPKASVTILPEMYEGGQTVPLAISDNGKVVVGVCSSPAGDPEQAVDMQAFRWTQMGGMTSLGTLPGYAQSAAIATNCDGAVIFGNSIDPDSEVMRAWVWTARTGLQEIPMPNDVEVISSEAVDVADDGTVFGAYSTAEPNDQVWIAPFLWSKKNGLLTLSGWGGYEEDVAMEPVAISADAMSVVFDRVDPEHDPDLAEGAWITDFGGKMAGGNWSQYPVNPLGSSVFIPTRGSWSRNGTTMGGYSRPVAGGWVTPALWTAEAGIRLLAPGIVGRVWCVSPDGTWAGGGNGDGGTAFIWNPDVGFQNLLVYIEQLDELNGTDVQSTFVEVGYPAHVYGFSDNNRRLIGTAGNDIFGLPCRGFVLDLR